LTKRETEQARLQDAGSRVLALRIDAKADVVKAARVVAEDVESLERLGYELRGLEIRGHLLRKR